MADAVDDADRDRGDRVVERVARETSRACMQPGEGVVERDVGAADRGGAGAAVGLEHVAVDGDLALAERDQVADRPQRPADEPLDLLGPAGLLAPGRLPCDPLGGGAGQHRVLGGDPALAGAPHPRRDVAPRPTRCRAPWSGPSRRAPTRRELGVVPDEVDRSQLVGSRPSAASGLGAPPVAPCSVTRPFRSSGPSPRSPDRSTTPSVSPATGRRRPGRRPPESAPRRRPRRRSTVGQRCVRTRRPTPAAAAIARPGGRSGAASSPRLAREGRLAEERGRCRRRALDDQSEPVSAE